LLLSSCADESSNSAEVIDNEKETIESTDEPVDLMMQENSSDSLDDVEERVSTFCETNFGVYIYDPGEEFTNVRNAPGGDVVLQLPLGDLDNEYLLQISGYEKGWFQLEGDVLGIEEDYEIPDGVGWVHHSVVACDTRNYANQKINLYENPDEESAVSGVIEFESGGLRPKEACGEWVLVELAYEDFYAKGWIKAEWLCGNPLTTCS